MVKRILGAAGLLLAAAPAFAFENSKGSSFTTGSAAIDRQWTSTGSTTAPGFNSGVSRDLSSPWHDLNLDAGGQFRYGGNNYNYTYDTASPYDVETAQRLGKLGVVFGKASAYGAAGYVLGTVKTAATTGRWGLASRSQWIGVGIAAMWSAFDDLYQEWNATLPDNPYVDGSHQSVTGTTTATDTSGNHTDTGSH